MVGLACMAAAPCFAQALPNQTDPLAFDSVNKEVRVKAGETNAFFAFSVANVSSVDVTIKSVRPSCGCSVAQMPATPWVIGPGQSGEIQANVDLRGKHGVLNKTLVLDTSAGYRLLVTRVVIPQTAHSRRMGMEARGRNLMIALADRQAVFKNDCIKCHVEPAKGKRGRELYQAACAICHETPHRATMVPDLRTTKHPENRDYWRSWITHGKAGSLMPAFALSEGGPLSEEQINSLVDYLNEDFKSSGSSPTTQPAPLEPHTEPEVTPQAAPSLPRAPSALPPLPLPPGPPAPTF